jgi:multimeric flavodoxin WrbA
MGETRKIAALILSPRRLGNCEILVKEICRHLPVPHELQLIRLTDKQIKPCKGCYSCLMTGKCPLDDDYAEVAGALSAADAVIIATPTYFLGANGMLKVFQDRCMQLFSGSFDLRGKPALNLVTAGLPHEAGISELMLNSFSLILGLEIRASEIFFGALPGEIFLDNEEQLARAAGLGGRLLGDEPRQFKPWACPLCGSDAVQLLGGDRVLCLACRNDGRLLLDNGEPRLEIGIREDNIFFTEEQVKRHGSWLKGMKERFLSLKGELAAICKPYADEGKWL